MAAHPDNKDMLQAERHKVADQALRKLVQTKKEVNDPDSEQSSSDNVSEPSDCDQCHETSDDGSDEKSDTMSVNSDRTFFKF